MAIRYSDKWLRWLGIPFLTFFTRHLGDPTSLFELLKKREYYADILAYFVITWIVWEVNYQLIRYFDRRYSWLTETFKRFILQAVVNLGLSGIILAVAIFVYQIPIMHREQGFYIEYLFAGDVPMFLVFVFIINLLYAILNIVQLYESRVQELQQELAQLREQPQSEAEKTTKKNLVVNKGNSMVPLPTDDIAYIYKSNEYNFVKAFDNQEYRVDYTLEQLSQMLSDAEFFRINRQMIANIEAIKQVQQKEQGGFMLRLQPQFSDEVTVSKKKASEFKAWIDR
ncbi:LytR/AlgR family response regulator transcription factor [Tellurirhabdus bombi]|uniref:LytR/AlgR family response regulator transcription factor n=1 Tax=Tellurirhabdus bombi TaxID=2907205 RepID=UPI001F3E7D20|nr:LytTR family DNA-binding domain-containing protein [Tellurirhabdus bombi]